jgi:hypothetical protein
MPKKNLKYGHNTVTSLKQGKLIDIEAEELKRIVSMKKDAAKKDSEQMGNDIKYEAELHGFMEMITVTSIHDLGLREMRRNQDQEKDRRMHQKCLSWHCRRLDDTSYEANTKDQSTH